MANADSAHRRRSRKNVQKKMSPLDSDTIQSQFPSQPPAQIIANIADGRITIESFMVSQSDAMERRGGKVKRWVRGFEEKYWSDINRRESYKIFG